MESIQVMTSGDGYAEIYTGDDGEIHCYVSQGDGASAEIVLTVAQAAGIIAALGQAIVANS